jgi:hypothetical protein
MMRRICFSIYLTAIGLAVSQGQELSGLCCEIRRLRRLCRSRRVAVVPGIRARIEF